MNITIFSLAMLVKTIKILIFLSPPSFYSYFYILYFIFYILYFIFYILYFILRTALAGFLVRNYRIRAKIKNGVGQGQVR
jgi:hypothetical protein